MGDAEEPTPRVGPCLEDTAIVDESTSINLHALLEPTEYNIVDLLIPHNELEVVLRVFIGLRCLHVLEVRVRGCGERAEVVKKLYEKPEFTSIVLESNCIEVAAPWDPPLRLLGALRLVGIEPPIEPIAYRVVDRFALDR